MCQHCRCHHKCMIVPSTANNTRSAVFNAKVGLCAAHLVPQHNATNLGLHLVPHRLRHKLNTQLNVVQVRHIPLRQRNILEVPDSQCSFWVKVFTGDIKPAVCHVWRSLAWACCVHAKCSYCLAHPGERHLISYAWSRLSTGCCELTACRFDASVASLLGSTAGAFRESRISTGPRHFCRGTDENMQTSEHAAL